MTPERIRAVIEEFFDLVRGDSGSPEENEKALATVLDELARASHAPCPKPETEEAEAPRFDGGAMRERVTERFPSLGLYYTGELMEDDDERPRLVGDAVDDLVDIAVDLAEAAWLFDEVGAADGLWQFHFSFDHHWGAHLRGLQWYLHENARSDS